MKGSLRRIAASLTILLSVPAVCLALTVSSKDLLPADGSSGQVLSVGNGIKTGHIQNGAVTPEKLAYTGVVFVHKAAGSPTIQGAINAAAQSATAQSRYLVKILPGEYDESVTLSPYVDLEGSGIDTTSVTCSSGASALKAVAAGTYNIRNLTVKNPAVGGHGLDVQGSAAVVVNNAKIVLAASDNYAVGVHLSPATSLQFLNSAVVAEGGNGAREGIAGNCVDLLVAGSSIKLTGLGTGYALGIDVIASGKGRIFNSQVEVATQGTDITEGVFVMGKGEIDTTRISVSSGTDAGGIWGADWVGDMVISNSHIDVASGMHTGVGRSYAAAPSATNGTGRIANSTLTGSVTGASVGAQLDITNSTVTGGVKAIENAYGGTYRIGASQISGSYDIGPSDKRVNCFDGDFLPVQ